MAKDLGLNKYKKELEQFGKQNSKWMTAALVRYLREVYPEKEEEYRLIYRKAEKFIHKF